MAGRLRQSLKAPAAAGWQLTAPCGRVSLERKAECWPQYLHPCFLAPTASCQTQALP